MTETVARRYFEAWTSRDSKTVAALLSPDFRFTAGDRTIEGRDAFLASGAFPADATATMVAEAYQGDVGLQMYDATSGDRSVRIVEQLTVRDGRLVSSTFVADTGRVRGIRGAMNRNPEVDRWLDAAVHPLDGAIRRTREIILAADERVTEAIKWKTPTFEYKGNIASFNPSKRFVSLLFHRGAEIPGEHPRLEGDGRLARTMRFADLEELEAGQPELEAVIRAWCDWKDGE